MTENSSPAPAVPVSVQFTIATAVGCLGVLVILLIRVGLITLDPHSSFRFRFIPWFSLAALALIVGWSLLTRRWWAPVALLCWDLAAIVCVYLLFCVGRGDL